MVSHDFPNTARVYTEQGSLGSWPARVLMTLAVLAVIACAVLAMRRGWRSRAGRQSGLPVLPTSGPAPAGEHVLGKYLGTVRAGDWLDRIVAAGGPAQASVAVGSEGVIIERSGDDPIVIAADRLVEVGTAPGLLQKVYGRHGVLLITWRWGSELVSTGVWFTDPQDQRLVRVAIDGITARSPVAGATPETV